MVDKLTDADLSRAIEAGKVYGDGAETRDKRIDMLVNALAKAEESIYGPKVEEIQAGPRVKIDDFRRISEDKITEIIRKKWGETDDSLVPTYIATLKGSQVFEGLIATEFFESTNPSPDLVEVKYQFARRGEYGDEAEFPRTEIVRFEFSNYNPDDENGSVLVPVTVGGELLEPPRDQRKKKFELSDNQFIDKERDLLVTFYSVPIV